MKLALGRIVSTLVTIGGWALVGVRTVLDLIGYSTVPEDAEVAQTRVDQFLGWLLGLPWWTVWGFVLITTLWLMWVSWPRKNSIATATEKAAEPIAENAQYNPWYEGGGPTFVELHLAIDEFRCKEITSENVFDTAVSMLGDDPTKLEILVVFNKLIASRNAAITCDNRLENYWTSVLKMTDRYLICQVRNVGSPAVIRIDCN